MFQKTGLPVNTAGRNPLGWFFWEVEHLHPQASMCSGLRLSLPPRSRPVAHSGLGVQVLRSTFCFHHQLKGHATGFPASGLARRAAAFLTPAGAASGKAEG